MSCFYLYNKLEITNHSHCFDSKRMERSDILVGRLWPGGLIFNISDLNSWTSEVVMHLALACLRRHS